MAPASRSAWLARYVPVQLNVAAGTSVAGVTGVQVSVGRCGSLTVTPVSVVLPLLVATRVYVIASPTWSYVVGLPLLVSVRLPDWLAPTVASALAVTVAPAGSLPVAAAVLPIEPASRSAWPTRYVPVQVTVAPGTSVAGTAGVQARAGSSGSLTLTP